MCVIFACEKDKQITDLKKNLELAEKKNSDGNSFSFYDESLKTMRYYKDISIDKVLKLIEKHNLSEFVFHSRLTSSGKTIPQLTHAFPINLKELEKDKLSGKTKAILYHNGTLDFNDLAKLYLDYCLKSGSKIINGELSDSKLLAILIDIYGYNFITLFVPKHSSSKFIIHDINGIHYFGSGWVEHDGIKCSNDNFIERYNYQENIMSNYYVNGYTKDKKTYSINDAMMIEEDSVNSDFEDYLTIDELTIFDKLIERGYKREYIINLKNSGYEMDEIRDNLLYAGFTEIINSI